MNAFRKSQEKPRTEIIDELRGVIASTGMPSNVRQIANKEIETLSRISAEYSIGLAYIDNLINLPWNNKTEDNPDLSRVERVLNERHYGLHKIKERILEYLTVNIFMANKILVVDDEKIALGKLEHTLKKEGYSVVTANSGEEAFRKLESSDFDLVITDLKMEKNDGIDVLEKTKSKCPDTRVIMMTGYSDVDTAVDAMRKGAFNYIEKPLRLETLRTVVRQALENKLTARTKKAPVLCFAGPPGTGKISFGKTIAEALGRKFARISMDKMKDEAEIRGHRRTFAGAVPGRIIEKICLTGSANPVLMLVGLDRIGDDFKGDPASALLEALDTKRNHDFIDNYLDMPFDLSSVMFIVTADIADNILSPLSDLIEVIEFSGYTEIEKIEIALKKLVPRQIYEKGLSGYPPEFTPEAISVIIKGYTREAGVRELERQIANVCRKIDAKIEYGDEIFQIIKLEPGQVEGYLGPRMY